MSTMTTPEDRERESQATDETKFERERGADETERSELAQDLADDPPLEPRDD